MTFRSRDILTHAGAFFGYTVLALVFTYPAVMHLGERLMGRGNDLWIFQWNNWWIQTSLSQGLNVYHSPYMFYPQGMRVPLYFHSFSWFNTLLWLLLKPFIGRLTAYNFTVIAVYALKGYTMYLLAREITDSQPASLLSGLVFAFFSKRRDLNHLHLFSTQWIPLVALYLIRLAKTGRLIYSIWAGAALALCGLCGWQLLILVGLWCVFWGAYNLLSGNWDIPTRTTAGILIAFCVCALVVFPLLWPVVNDGLLHGNADLTAGTSSEGGTDLITYLLPNRHHLLTKIGPLRRVYQKFIRVQGASTFPGFTVIGLIFWAVIGNKEKAALWGSVAIVFSLLSLGSVLEINGRSFSFVPTPYRLLDVTLLGKIIRRPDRLNIIVGLAIAATSAIGAADLFEKLKQTYWRYVLTFCLGVVIFLEYIALPFPTSLPIYSDFFRELRQSPGQFAVADFPIGYLAHDKWYMHAQTIHERPMVGGHVSRVSEHAHDFINSVPVLKTARNFSPAGGTLDDVSRQLEPLAEVDIRYVLIHKYRARPGEEDGWRKWFAIHPHYEDQHLVVFRTAPQYGQDFNFMGEIGDGIGVISATLSTYALAQEGVLETEIIWGTRKAPSHEWTAYLALVGENGQEAQRSTFQPCSSWPTSKWGSDAIARGRGSLQVDPFVERGVYTAVIGLTNPKTGRQAGAPVAVGEVNVQAIERVFEVPEMEFESGATFGDVLKLLGYDLQQSANQLTLTLHWQALRQMEESYKFFVHLVDVESGQVMVQADVIPYDWTYPTIWWIADEVVSDKITLPLENIELQDCQLEIGVYHANSGERLPLISTHKLQNLPDRLILRDDNPSLTE